MIIYTKEDFTAKAKGMHVVYDSVGQSTFMQSLDCLRPRGMMVSFGNASGPVTDFCAAHPQPEGLAVPDAADAGELHSHRRGTGLARRRRFELDRTRQTEAAHPQGLSACRCRRRRSAIWKAARRPESCCCVSPDRAAIPFGELKIDALLVSAPPNIRYLSGFTGDNGLLLVTPDSQTLFTDPRFTIQAAEECTCEVKTVTKTPLDQAALQAIRRKRFKRIGFEASRMLYEVHQRIAKSLPRGVTLKPIGPVVDKLRMVKSDDEIARIRRSVLTNSEAFEKATRSIRPGARESTIAAELEYQMRRLGAEKAAFETIVAAGIAIRAAARAAHGAEARKR